MGILDVTVYPANANKNPGNRVLSDFGDLDWAHFGRSAVTDFESKSGASILNDFSDIGSPTLTRVVGTAGNTANCSWSSGSPTATEAGTLTYVRNTVNSAGFRLDTAALDPAKIYRFVFFVGGVSSTSALDISLSEGSASSFNTSLTASGTVTWEVAVVVRVDSATEYLRFDWTKTSGTSHRLQAVYVQDFGYELSLYDTFTDTNGTGIESHTPDYARESASYEAVGATTTSADPTGSGGITIQDNQLQLSVSSERARFYTGSKDNVVEAFWVISSTSGHRIGISPRHVDKSNQYWFNLREPNDDYSFYTEDEDDAPTNQTNLLGGAQSYTFDTSKTYYVRVSVIGLVMRMEIDGELINTYTDGADAIPGADGISIGTAGISTNNHFDSLKVWSPAYVRATLAASTSAVSVSSSGQASVKGSVSELLGNVSGNSTGDVVAAGTASPNTGNATGNSAGVVTITGAVAEVLAATSVSAAGSVTASAEGSVVATTEATTISASGLARVVGSVAETLDALTSDTSGVVEVLGLIAETLEDSTLSANGEAIITGTIAETTAASTPAVVGLVEVLASIGETLANTGFAGVGDVRAIGSLATALTSVLFSGSGLAGNAVSGTLSLTLADSTVSAQGLVPYVGAVSATLGDTSLSGVGLVRVVGSISEILEGVSPSLSGTVVLPSGAISITLQDVVVAGTGVVKATGAAVASLDQVVLSGVGEITAPPTTGTIAVTLQDVVLSSSGSLELVEIVNSEQTVSVLISVSDLLLNSETTL